MPTPSLYAIYVEPLATANKGIQSTTVNHKTSSYADDILLYLQNPQVSLPEIMNIFYSFFKLSNYGVNWSKSAVTTLKKRAGI